MPPDELRARLDRIEATLDRLQAQIRAEWIPLLCLGADGDFTWCVPGQVAPGAMPVPKPTAPTCPAEWWESLLGWCCRSRGTGYTATVTCYAP
jgi:hypothetical protein